MHKNISMIEVDSLEEIPKTEEGFKYFACIGGGKNYQCFLESNKLSRAEFMNKYNNFLDKCHIPLYEDDDIVIRQDAQIPIPGFYIVATKKSFKRISEMDIDLYNKCLYYSFLIKKGLREVCGVDRVFMYYDEHYNKPSSTHFWVLPIYDDVQATYNYNLTILSKNIWDYQEVFEFSKTKDKIYKYNSLLTKYVKENKGEI